MPCKTEMPGLLTRIKQIPGVNTAYAIHAIGSEDAYIRLLSQVTRIMPQHIRQMDEHLAGDDWSLFRVKAHGVKGSLRQVGYLSMALTAEMLEAEAEAGNGRICREQYPPFRKELCHFVDQLGAALRDAGDTPSAQAADLGDYLDALAQVKAALEDYDSLLAAELLAPLTKKRFGKSTDTLIANVYEELASYRPEAALAYLKKLV